MGAMSLGFPHESFPCPLPAERYGPAIADLELFFLLLLFSDCIVINVAAIFTSARSGMLLGKALKSSETFFPRNKALD